MQAPSEAEPSKTAPPQEKAARVVWALAWPAVALNSMQVINNLLDSSFIGHLSTPNLMAHGGATSVLFLLFSLAMALGTAATALVSRAFGAKQLSEMTESARQSSSLGFYLSLLLTVVGYLGAGFSAKLLLKEGETEAIHLMTEFLKVYALGLPAIYVIQSLAGSLRGVGDTKSPMVISGLQIALHIALNFILIFPARPLGSFGVMIPGANMGLVGASTALSVSAWMSAIVYLLYAHRTQIGRQKPWLLPSRKWVGRILRIAAPAALMAVLRVFSLMAFQFVLKYAHDGGPAIAALRIGFAIESIMFMPAFGLSMAAAALVGQNLGAKNPERAEKLAWAAAHHAALVTAVLCVPIFLFAPQIAGSLLGHKPEVVTAAVLLIRWLCATEIFFAYAMVMIGAMQGAGDTKRPLWITVISLWFLRVPLAVIMALPFGFAMGAAGAWAAMSLTQAVQGILAVIFFRKGAWKTARV